MYLCPVTLKSYYAQDGGTDKGRGSGQGIGGKAALRAWDDGGGSAYIQSP